MARTAENLVLALASRQNAKSSAADSSLDERPQRHCARRRLAASSGRFMAKGYHAPVSSAGGAFVAGLALESRRWGF